MTSNLEEIEQFSQRTARETQMPPLYECSQCGYADNTATGDYWVRYLSDGLPPLCSECSRGKWHGFFPKNTPDELGLVRGEDWKLRKPKD